MLILVCSILVVSPNSSLMFDLLLSRLAADSEETDSWSETSIQTAQATLDIVNNATPDKEMIDGRATLKLQTTELL